MMHFLNQKLDLEQTVMLSNFSLEVKGICIKSTHNFWYYRLPWNQKRTPSDIPIPKLIFKEESCLFSYGDDAI